MSLDSFLGFKGFKGAVWGGIKTFKVKGEMPETPKLKSKLAPNTKIRGKKSDLNCISDNPESLEREMGSGVRLR